MSSAKLIMSAAGAGAAGQTSMATMGTVRETTAEETLVRIIPIAKQLGITRLANLTGLDQVGVPVWMAVRPLALSLTVSQGKGLTDELSKCSALMESIETYHAEHFIPEGVELPLSAYRRDPAFVNPELLPRPDESFPADDPVLLWVPARDIASGKPRWIPHELFSLDATKRRVRPALFITSSNGLASGNTCEEAVLHGICEVVERDQVSCWLQRDMQSPRPPSKIILNSVEYPGCRAIIDRCANLGLDLHVWYATVDLALPVFWAVAADADGNTHFPHRAIGSGCHPSKEIALSRALTEALQIRLSNISGVRDDIGWLQYRNNTVRCPADWIKEVRSREETVDFRAVEDASCPQNIPVLLEHVQRTLRLAGVNEILAVDLTRDGIDIPVVFICIPGLGSLRHRPIQSDKNASTAAVNGGAKS
jgi:YcaO-like protein with predicted kinase domain